MDTLNAYRDIIERVLENYTKLPYAQGDLQCEAIFDRQRDRYALMTVGWDKHKRVHHPLIHIDIVSGKVWIQADNTDRAVATELVEAGIPKSDIVLAFRSPAVRKYTEYAVA
ncbi:MAG: XisI protein [Gemmataceae bacterium]|nr:XisI protein [Gemmataceae bacterium]